MANASQPFLQQFGGGSSRFPEKTFDPKAVTRASWEPKRVRPKQDGPLLQFNRHPDAHGVLSGQRRPMKTMSRRMKSIIKAVRVVQLIMRFLQLLGASGLLVLMIIISNVPDLTAWVMRITAGVVIVHCVYGVYHMAKPAGARTPASSAAYQLFSAFSDLCVLPMYVYGLLSVRRDSGSWSTLLSDKAAVADLKTALCYTLIGAGALHLATLVVACWLGVKFRQITLMPPDMNPLEDNLTSRTKTSLHSRNKSSVVTIGSLQSLELEKEKGFVRPPAVPFAHTRTQTRDSVGSRDSRDSRDSRLDLPSRRYQVAPSNASSALSSTTTLKRASVAGGTPTNTIGRGAYAEISPHESYAPHHRSRGSRSSRSSRRRSLGTPAEAAPGTAAAGNETCVNVNGNVNEDGAPRQTRFRENWYASDSLVNRTQQRNQALNTMVLNASGMRRDYNPLNQNLDYPESDGSGSDTDTIYHQTSADGAEENGSGRYENFRLHPNILGRFDTNNTTISNNVDGDDDDDLHPSPLRSNPKRRAIVPHQVAQVAQTAQAFRQASVTPTVSSMTSAVSSGTSGSLAEAAAREQSGSDSRVLGEPNANGRWLSSGGRPPQQQQQTDDLGDLGDGAYGKYSNAPGETTPTPTRQGTGRKRWTWAPRNRDSSIQADDSFYSKPYGHLKAATPPIMVGRDLSGVPAGRQVSSGNDYDLGSGFYNAEGEAPSGVFGRRHVSGKMAEEGRVRYQ